MKAQFMFYSPFWSLFTTFVSYLPFFYHIQLNLYKSGVHVLFSLVTTFYHFRLDPSSSAEPRAPRCWARVAKSAAQLNNPEPEHQGHDTDQSNPNVKHTEPILNREHSQVVRVGSSPVWICGWLKFPSLVKNHWVTRMSSVCITNLNGTSSVH